MRNLPALLVTCALLALPGLTAPPPLAAAGGPIKIVHLGDIPLPADPVVPRPRPGKEGELWVSLSDGSLAVVDADAMKVVAQVPDIGAGSWGLAFHPDGSRVYGTNWMANELVVVDTGRRAIERKINVGLKPAFIRVDPGGTRAHVSNFFSGELSVVDLSDASNGRSLQDVDVGRRPMGLAVDHARNRVYVGSGAGRTLTILDAGTGQVLGTRPIQFASTHDLAITRDGSMLVAAGYPDSLLVLDPRDDASEVQRIPVGRDPVGVAVDRWGRYAFVSNYQDDTLSVVDLGSGRQIQTYPTAEGPMFLSLGPQGRRLYLCANEAQVLSVFAVGDPEVGLAPPVKAASSPPDTAR